MANLSTESIIPAGTDIYHSSYGETGLLVVGKFDIHRVGNEGAMYFTPVPVLATNCVVTAAEDLVVFDFTTLPDKELTLIDEAGGTSDTWEGAVVLGYDGRLLSNNDPYTKISQGVYCDELMIFRDSLRKLGDIRRFSE